MPVLPQTAQQVTANSSGKATITADAAIITSASLSTGGGATTTFTIGCSLLTPGSIVLSSIQNGTNSGGTPQILTTDPGTQTVTIVVENTAASTAFNGTVIISIVIFN